MTFISMLNSKVLTSCCRQRTLIDMTNTTHEHEFFWFGPDGTKFESNACHVEGCKTFRAVPVKRRRRPATRRTATKATPATGNGPESLRSLLQF